MVADGHTGSEIAMTTSTPPGKTKKPTMVQLTTRKGNPRLTLTMMDEDQTVLMEGQINLGVLAEVIRQTRTATTGVVMTTTLKTTTKDGAAVNLSLPSQPQHRQSSHLLNLRLALVQRLPRCLYQLSVRHDQAIRHLQPLWGRHPLLLNLLHPLWVRRIARLYGGKPPLLRYLKLVRTGPST